MFEYWDVVKHSVAIINRDGLSGGVKREIQSGGFGGGMCSPMLVRD
jgi:hypothetical protein